MARFTPSVIRSSWYEVELLDERREGNEVVVTARLLRVKRWHPLYWWNLLKAVVRRPSA